MLFIKSLPETTRGEDIFNHIMQYSSDKGIPLTNLIYIELELDEATTMTERIKGFVSRMKSIAPHIFDVYCIVHSYHLAGKNIRRSTQRCHTCN